MKRPVSLILSGVLSVAFVFSTSGCERSLSGGGGGEAECGNLECEEGETPFNCPEDCVEDTCGNHHCDPGEDAQNCPSDCPVVTCGDGLCRGTENPYTCPEDCESWVCGNGLCEPGEGDGGCPSDCLPDQCGNGICEHQETPHTCAVDCPATTKVDLLFVVDNSQSMLNEQQALRAQFPALMTRLEAAIGHRPDMHIGVVTPDLGVGNYTTIPFCEDLGGDGGVLGMASGTDLAQTCVGQGQRYMADVEPSGCDIDKLPSGMCGPDNCAQQHCDAAAAGNEALTLYRDAAGCPRCRNFGGSVDDTFSCMADVGADGCGFEQQLEAIHRSLDANPSNAGFLRDDALLSVVLISDEDDCSASRPDVIFNPDPAENQIDSTLGYLHSFRCFEFGVMCDVNGREPGPRNLCEPRDDPQALLHSVSRYVDLLTGLKDPGRLVVAAITGPYEGGVLLVAPDDQDRPAVQPSCTDATGSGAVPAVRFRGFVQRFNDPDDIGQWAMTSVCDNNFTSALSGIGEAIARKLGSPSP